MSIRNRVTDVLALDFDGVLCDSVLETAMTGWRAMGRFWPATARADPPPDYEARFRRLRPVLEVGYESAVIARLIYEGADLAAVPADFSTFKTRLLRDHGLTSETMIPSFAEVRDHWLRTDLDGWLGLHRFFGDAVRAVGDARHRRVPVFVISTKQRRFLQALLDRAGLPLPAGTLFGLEAGRKPAVLRQLLLRSELHGATVHFVEDRLKTLLSVRADGRLGDVRLCFAEWGYCTAAERARAAADPAIQTWSLPAFVAFVKRCAGA